MHNAFHNINISPYPKFLNLIKMKKINLFISFIALVTITTNVNGQVANPTIQVIGLGTTNPTNSGEVPLLATLDLLITVGNTGTANITANRVRPRITLPNIVELLPNAQQTLPPGWSIINSTAQTINICNGTDIIPVNGNRSIIIKVRGISLGAGQNFTGQLFFGGTSSCTASGSAQNSSTIDDFGQSALTVVVAPLPLTLLTFNATLVKCEPSLTWVTENELNTDRFEIERGSASGSNFTKVGTVAANGNSSSQIRYNFLDSKTDALSEKVFYRLKMIDKDGLHKYSDIATVVINCNTPKVSIYPNPIQDDKIFINLAGTVGRTQATLSSMTGQLIARNNMVNGSNSINVSNIADGIYILTVKDENGFNSNNKIVIKH